MHKNALIEALKAKKPTKPLIALRLPQEILDRVEVLQKKYDTNKTKVLENLIRAGLSILDK